MEAFRVVPKELLGLVIYVTNTAKVPEWYCEAGFRVVFRPENPNLHDPQCAVLRYIKSQ